jgi:hypothetical protein
VNAAVMRLNFIILPSFNFAKLAEIELKRTPDTVLSDLNEFRSQPMAYCFRIKEADYT